MILDSLTHDDPTSSPADPPDSPSPALLAGVQPELPGITLTPLGADVTGPIDWDATVTRLVALKQVGAAWRWTTGDMILALAADRGGDMAPVFQVLADHDLDTRASLMKSIAVSQRIPFDRRRPELSWSHHEAVAGITDPDMQAEWLAAAVVNGWTAHQLIAELRAASRPEQPELADDTGPMIPPHLPTATVKAIDALWATEPTVAVIVRSDGTWGRLTTEAIEAALGDKGAA